MWFELGFMAGLWYIYGCLMLMDFHDIYGCLMLVDFDGIFMDVLCIFLNGAVYEAFEM
jgi:hypothetical protein